MKTNEISIIDKNTALICAKAQLELTQKLLSKRENGLRIFTNYSIASDSGKELLGICCHYVNDWLETDKYSFSSLTNDFEKCTHVQLNASSFRMLMGLYSAAKYYVDDKRFDQFDAHESVCSLVR
ncbi:hypothetical protein [Spirosoma arcticum]